MTHTTVCVATAAATYNSFISHKAVNLLVTYIISRIYKFTTVFLLACNSDHTQFERFCFRLEQTPGTFNAFFYIDSVIIIHLTNLATFSLFGWYYMPYCLWQLCEEFNSISEFVVTNNGLHLASCKQPTQFCVFQYIVCFVSFCVLFVCKCVLCNCLRVTTNL